MSWETHSRKNQSDRKRRFEQQRNKQRSRRQRMVAAYVDKDARGPIRFGDKMKGK
jgi:hypothetical protein